MRPFKLIAVAIAACAAFASTASADLIYDTSTGASGFAAPPVFAPRVLDFITIDALLDQEVDGLQVAFTVRNASSTSPKPVQVFTQFWANVDPDGPNPLSGAISLGTIGYNFGSITASGGYVGGSTSGLAATNDVILPAGTVIGVEQRFRIDGSTFQPDATVRMVDPNSNNVGTTTSFFYIDDETTGFGSDDSISKGGKVVRIQIHGIAIPEPATTSLLSLVGILALRRRR